MNNSKLDVKWNKINNSLFLLASSDGLKNKLDPVVYRVVFDQQKGFYLEYQHGLFPMPKKVYSFDTNPLKTNMDTVFVSRFKEQTKNLGVLLLGEKGSGKSLLMKAIANNAMTQGIPVISVENTFSSEGLSIFLSSIEEEAVVIFDEFDKKYNVNEENDYNSQVGLLSFFDGTTVNKKLIVLTANSEHLINEFLINRPSRIRYTIKYDGLTDKFVSNYLNDNLKYPEIKNDIINELSMVENINFDLLNIITTEVNTVYTKGVKVKDIVEIMNIKRDNTSTMYYTITVKFDNCKEYKQEFVAFNWDSVAEGGYYMISMSFLSDHCIVNENNPKEVFNGQFKITYDKVKQLRGRDKFVFETTNPEVSIYGPDLKPMKKVTITFERLKFSKLAF